MSKEINQKLSEVDGLIPELRFPDFVEDGEWLEKNLIDVTNKKVKWSFTGGPFGSNLKASDYTTSGIRIIQLQNIGDGEFKDDYKIYTSIEKADELLSCNIYSGDIILSKMGDPVGRACIIPEVLERSVMASDGIRLVVNEGKYSKYFIYSLINSKRIRKVIEMKATGSTRKRIGLNVLRQIPLIIPNNLKEQQKIASCLSSLDELITAHNDKLKALKDHKKGLMQNLFPQEGQKIPNYRFKEFEEDGEWVEKKLTQVADYENGKAHEKDIDDNGKYIVVNSKFISTEGEVVKFSEKAYCPAKKDDILMVLSDVPNGRAIAKCFYVNEDDRYSVNQRVCKITAFDADKLFLFYIMDRNSYFLDFDDGVKQTNLRKDDVLDFSFLIPDNPEEQRKISLCISAVDEFISVQAENIEQLQQHKKGLMQGLFPKIKS